MKDVLKQFHQAFQVRDYYQVISFYQKIAIEKILQQEEKCRITHRLAIAYQEIGNYDEALSIYKKLLADYPEFQVGWEFYAQCLEKNKNFEMALSQWQNIAKKFPTSTFAYWSMGNIYKNHFKDYDKAIEMYQTQIERFPNRQSGYQGLAETLQAKKEYDKAIDAWVVVQDKFPNNKEHIKNKLSNIQTLKQINISNQNILADIDKKLGTDRKLTQQGNVIGIRTHKWQQEEQETYDMLLQVFDKESIFVVVDEMGGKYVEIPKGINKISLNDALLTQYNLLYFEHKIGLGWLCGDYFYYALANKIIAQNYWLIEPDVRFTFKNLKDFFDKCDTYQEDALLVHFEKTETWFWTKHAEIISDDVYKCLFPISRLSFDAIKVCLLERIKLHKLVKSNQYNVKLYPNDESLVATSVKKYGLSAIALNDIWKSSFKYFSLHTKVYPSFRLSIEDNQVVHPVRYKHQIADRFVKAIRQTIAKEFSNITIHNDDINDFCDDIIKKLDNDFLKEIAFEQNSIKEYYCLVELAVSKTCLDNPKIWIFDNHTIVVDCMIGKYSLGMDFIIKSSYLKCEIFTRYENIDVEQINDFFNAKILNAHRIEYCNHAISNEELIEKEIVSIIEKFSYFIMTLASHITKQKLEELYNIYQQKNYQLFIDGSESLLSKNQLDIIQKQSLLEKLADSYKCVKQIGKSIQTYHVLIDSGKQNQNIYETLANLYEHNKEFHKSIQTWEIVAEKFPKSVFAFWSIGNIYKNHLKDYDKAIEMYQKQIGRFPERKSGYQGLAESLYDAKRYEEALIAWEHIKQKYPDEPKSYWTIGQIYKATEQSELAEKTFLELINNFPNRESGYWNMAMLKFNLQRWADAKYYWEQYFNKFSANEDVYFNYLKILINLNQDNIGFCETIAKKTGKNIQDILLKYVLFLRNYNKFSQLENVSYQLIGEYPKVSQFAEMYFIALYCQKKWLLAKNAYHQLINKFDIKLNDVTYTYLDVLWHLKQHDDLEIFYLKMLKKTYPQILKYYPSYDFSLDKIAIAETVGNFKESDKLRQSYIPLIDIQFVNKPAFDETIECEYIHHSDNNKALLIFFSGLTFKIKNNFDKHGFENFEQLKEDNKEIKSSFIRFAQKNTQYNMLMINDIYNSWEQLHKMEYLNYIKKTIDKYKPKTVVCVGVSSGGYAAMLYGQLIKANLVFAFSPQTIPFFNYANYLGHLYRNHFSLGMQAEDSVIRLQNQQGFYAKTYIIVSKYNGMDLIGLNQLDRMDKNLLVTYCKSYEHVPIQGLGVKNVYSEMCRVIDVMIESNNQSPILLDIFLKFPTFDHNSYQNNSY